MKKILLIGTLSLASAGVFAEDSCGSLSSLSDDSVLRNLQVILGLKEESSLYRRCAREMGQARMYQSGDVTYFSDDSTADEVYRSNISTDPVIPHDGIDIPLLGLEKGLRTQEKSEPVMSLERLRNADYRSVGVYAD